MMAYDTIIIGGGLFGSVITRALKDIGQDVLVLDQGHQARGSSAAACLMKPSWLGALSKDQQRRCLTLLDDMYGVQDLIFKVGPGKATVHWVPPKSILVGWGVREAIVSTIRRCDRGWETYYKDGGVDVARRLIVAAGVWTDDVLMKVHKYPLAHTLVQAQAGLALLFPRTTVLPEISPWAPYKQLVKFNRGDGAWAGDGSAIKEANWDAERHAKVRDRIVRYIHPEGIVPPPKELYGLRPYVKEMGGQPAYLREHAPDLWVATGGAKNGTIGAAWCATELKERFA
jgi:glycine/D-amino acid oxidase-like deaminating enzyme